MDLPAMPPLAPMLARLARELPESDDLLYEPKWDGFRCVVFRDGDEIEMYSRNQRPLGRYFPELVAALRSLDADRFVLDGEIVIARADGFDFTALLARLHPAASRAALLADETPAIYIAFDLVASGAEDLRDAPFVTRRRQLEALLKEGPARIALTPATGERDVASGWLEQPFGTGIDGVIAKRSDLRYQPNKRAMVKVKREQTADCVVAGFRVLDDDSLVASLLLGLYDDHGALRHVGVASSFTQARRRQLLDQLQPFTAPIEGHPWEQGFGLGRSPVGRLKGAAGRWTPELELDWIPLRPELVCEVAYDHWDGERFRHPARFIHWRPDRDPGSCTLDQMHALSGS